MAYVALPLILLISFGLLVIFWQIFNLPSNEDMITLAENYYNTYGYWVVFVAALVEGFLVFGWYLPGSVIAAIGVSLSYGKPVQAGMMVLLIAVAFYFDYLLAYFLGKYGWYRLFLKLGLKKPLEDMKPKVEKRGLPIIFTTYFHTNLGVLTATSAGILQLDFKKFALYSFIANLFWAIFWGILVYFFGSYIIQIAGVWVIAVFLVVWIIYLIGKFYFKGLKNS